MATIKIEFEIEDKNTVLEILNILNKQEAIESILDKNIHELGEFSCRAENVFSSANIKTPRDLIKTSRKQLLRIRNMGKATISEIDAFMKRHYLKFQEQ